MDNNKQSHSRKRFLGITISGAALFTAFRFFIPEKKKKTNTVKMLTRDGKLVEVDAEKLFNSTRKKISEEELKNWLNKK